MQKCLCSFMKNAYSCLYQTALCIFINYGRVVKQNARALYIVLIGGQSKRNDLVLCGGKHKVRITTDYSTDVNDSIEDYSKIIPSTEDFLSRIKGNYFCLLDLSDAFNNVPIKEECRKLRTIVTKWKCFKYKRLPQGLKISPLFFQENLKEMFDLVNEVMYKLDRMNLRIKKEKMKLFKRSLIFLGYQINSTERRICEERLTIFKNLREPRTKKELESIQRLLSYYGSFMSTLYKLDLPLILATDASEHSMRETLFHKFEDGTTKPILSAAKEFNEHELKYDIANKETLSVVYFVKRFEKFLKARKFELHVDSRALYCIYTTRRFDCVLYVIICTFTLKQIFF
uniref:Reverse transcriptase domain-containing protein n=1 Tax=Strongyloides papillosus TaxID=174720 RepID=A0A0N5CIN8_STREA